jgi:hypothetical protein
MKAELIKNFVKRELLNKHLTNELGQLSQYGKEFMINHFHLPEDRVPTDLFDESGITCIGSPREIRSEVDLMREAANPNHWVRFLYQDITPDVIYNFCNLFDILAKDNASGYDVVWELGGHWSTGDCPAGVPIGTYVNQQIERCIFKQRLMENLRRRIEQDRARMRFASRYQYEPNHVWEWGDRMTSIRPRRMDIGYDLGYGRDFNAWSTWDPTGRIINLERETPVESGFPDPEQETSRYFDAVEMEKRYKEFIKRMETRDDDEWFYDGFNRRWIELTKKEPEIDFNSPEWTEVKL